MGNKGRRRANNKFKNDKKRKIKWRPQHDLRLLGDLDVKEERPPLTSLARDYLDFMPILKSQNLRLIEVESDGNCLFRSISVALY